MFTTTNLTTEQRLEHAGEFATSALLRYVRVTEFHRLEADAIYLAICEVLILLEEQGVEALLGATGEGHPSVWSFANRLARRCMICAKVRIGSGYTVPQCLCFGGEVTCPQCR